MPTPVIAYGSLVFHDGEAFARAMTILQERGLLDEAGFLRDSDGRQHGYSRNADADAKTLSLSIPYSTYQDVDDLLGGVAQLACSGGVRLGSAEGPLVLGEIGAHGIRTDVSVQSLVDSGVVRMFSSENRYGEGVDLSGKLNPWQNDVIDAFIHRL